jgi:hypothetical protein
MTPLGDRRAHARLEVVGSLVGRLEWSEFVRALDISATGALVESPVPMAPNSRQSLNLLIGGEAIVVDAHVRRLERRSRDSNQPAYLIGLEFASPPQRLVQWVENFSSGRAEGT